MDEEKFLARNLPGYREYQEKVRYRLIHLTFGPEEKLFLDVGILHNSIQGWGPDISLGLAGSVFGGDHLALFFQHQAVTRLGTPQTVIGARYNWFY